MIPPHMCSCGLHRPLNSEEPCPAQPSDRWESGQSMRYDTTTLYQHCVITCLDTLRPNEHVGGMRQAFVV
eukprot:1866325-Pyramimonas_sp.AAC.3